MNLYSPDDGFIFNLADAIQILQSAAYLGSSGAGMAHPAGEAESDALGLDFDRLPRQPSPPGEDQLSPQASR